MNDKEFFKAVTTAIKDKYGFDIGSGHPEDRVGLEMERDDLLHKMEYVKTVFLDEGHTVENV